MNDPVTEPRDQVTEPRDQGNEPRDPLNDPSVVAAAQPSGLRSGDASAPLSPGHPPLAPGLRDLSQGLSWAALGLLAAFLLAMVDSILPLRLADPAWQLAIVIALVDNAAIPLVALALLHVAAWSHPRDGFSAALRDGAARWAVPVALGFLLLVPAQAWNGWRLQQDLRRQGQLQEQQLQRRFLRLRQAVDQAPSAEALQQRLGQLVGPGLPALNPATPLPQLRRELRRILARNQELASRQQQQRQRPSAPGRDGLLGAPLRGALACLAYALAFAGLARRRTQRLSLLSELLMALPVAPPARQPQQQQEEDPHFSDPHRDDPQRQWIP